MCRAPPKEAPAHEDRAAEAKREQEEACRRAHAKGVRCEEDLPARTTSSIEHEIARGRPKMRVCYNEALKTQPTLQLVFRFTLVIAKDGTVRSLTDAGTTRTDPQVSSCVQAVLRAMVFPAAGEETTLNVPVRFAPP